MAATRIARREEENGGGGGGGRGKEGNGKSRLRESPARNEVGYRNLYYADIIKQRSVRQTASLGPLIRICNIHWRPFPLFVPASPPPSAYHLSDRTSPSRHPRPSSGPAVFLRLRLFHLHLPHSLIKGSNYATSSTLVLRPSLDFIFPSGRIVTLCSPVNETVHTCSAFNALNAEYELSSKLSRTKPT